MKNFFLTASLLTLLILTLSATAMAQGSPVPGEDSLQTATVDVMVTNTRKLPRKGEEVMFISEKSRKQYTGRTNAAGKFSFALATGDVYLIKLRTLNDTTSYSTIEIPALERGQYFDSPFSINIEYEPAKTYTLNNVHFDTGKPSLRPESFKELNEIAEYMKIKDDLNFEIGGHTDNVGKEAENLRLSEQRAISVKNYLVKKGVRADRLTAKGFGDSMPVADNSTEEGRQKNRRTEISLL